MYVKRLFIHECPEKRTKELQGAFGRVTRALLVLQQPMIVLAANSQFRLFPLSGRYRQQGC